MLKPRFAAWTVSVGLIVLATGVVFGQTYPNRSIRMVTAGVGGDSDFTSRVIAQGISGGLGQQVIVDNRPSGIIPGQTVAKAPPDGYTLLVAGSSLWIGPLFRDDPPYDPVRDFSPVTLAVRSPNVLVVHPSLPVKSVKELIALAKARPGGLSYGSGPSGTQSQLAMELFKYMAGVKIEGIPYSSSSVRIPDFISGQVQVMIDGAGAMTPYIKAGKMRPVAVTSIEPSALMPGVPTVAAAGLPGFESVGMQGVFAPAKTPAPIINRLNQEIVRFVKTTEAKERFLSFSVEAFGSSPEELAAAVNSERDRLGKVIKAAGIRAQ